MGDETAKDDVAKLTDALAEAFGYQTSAEWFVRDEVVPLLRKAWAQGLRAGHDNQLRFDNPYGTVS